MMGFVNALRLCITMPEVCPKCGKEDCPCDPETCECGTKQEDLVKDFEE